MRFKQYITEEVSIEKIAEKIVNDCQPYLKQINKADYDDPNQRFLLSGRRSNSVFDKKTVRQDREPLDTNAEVHKWFDNWFYKKFGIKARSQTVFCTGSNSAYGYGNAYYIFPIGNFEVIWSRDIKDFYSLSAGHRIEFDDVEFTKNLFFGANYDKSYVKGHLKKALESNNEIMVYCKEYYIYEKRNTYSFELLQKIKELQYEV